MSIQEYVAIEGLKCKGCGTEENVTYDDDGNEVCFDCLFEASCDPSPGVPHSIDVNGNCNKGCC